ncbi:hypothetical protein [Aphanothece sacrum]|uniref:Uncharacterized protein n=1 Tax=Aphanothece sacrum FPU1 TaxID=1920663 RepID=A0A401IG82_APHSA|nr:hypothetical protein [Aphanothece sacrum]GBF80219.1 hypothetical protein AsFPU1_1620 [Aphanothece sacrum FPU1]GBF85372.1 hypothetical protein AsFPU3_2431 [Aphanothece sacrum FPU3]
MSYSEFTLSQLESEFNLILQERVQIFKNIQSVTPSPLLREILEENIPLALDIDTEKARSELIISPIMVELRKYFNRQISFFSGVDFSVDKSKGLTGRCDFIISYSPKQLEVTAPVVTLVEAKNDNIKSGIPQCIAEMVAAQIFNERQQNQISCIYGVVTTGSNWKFLRLVENLVDIEAGEHFIGDLEGLFGILLDMIKMTHLHFG